jgi:L-ribulose-5-phosphate 3-epimerase
MQGRAMKQEEIKIGIYEKALPYGLDWPARLSLAERLGFQFIEISVDEKEERLARLDWGLEDRKAFVNAVIESPLAVPSMCLSGHRRFPFGSHDPEIRKQALAIMAKAIHFAVDTGIRTIQLAGYDVYYEEGDADTRRWYIEGMQQSLTMAAREQVMLAVEIMDHPFMNSVLRFVNLKRVLDSPWFTVYPDIGNLSAWGVDVDQELTLGIGDTVALHLKDALAVTPTHGGTFKEVPFGSGCVDFPAVFASLKRLHYQGPFLIEMWTERADDSEKEITAARQWIFDQMRAGGYIDG